MTKGLDQYAPPKEKELGYTDRWYRAGNYILFTLMLTLIVDITTTELGFTFFFRTQEKTLFAESIFGTFLCISYYCFRKDRMLLLSNIGKLTEKNTSLLRMTGDQNVSK